VVKTPFGFTSSPLYSTNRANGKKYRDFIGLTIGIDVRESKKRLFVACFATSERAAMAISCENPSCSSECNLIKHMLQYHATKMNRLGLNGAGDQG
jgi:hypothetical protein